MKGKVRMIKVEKEKKDNEELKEKSKKVKRKFCFKNQGGKREKLRYLEERRHR